MNVKLSYNHASYQYTKSILHENLPVLDWETGTFAVLVPMLIAGDRTATSGAPLAISSLTYSFLETTRADPEPTASDHSPEKRIADGKDPWWRSVVQNRVHPVRHERSGIYRIAGTGAEHHLERSQRADCTEPGLNDYHDYGHQVRQAKPGIPNPRPLTSLAGDDQHEAKHDESYEKCVQQQDRVSSQLDEQGWFHLRHSHPYEATPRGNLPRFAWKRTIAVANPCARRYRVRD